MQNIKRNIARLKSSMSSNDNVKVILEQNIQRDHFPLSPRPNVKSNQVIYQLLGSNPVCMGCIDFTDRPPFCSEKGNQYPRGVSV